MSEKKNPPYGRQETACFGSDLTGMPLCGQEGEAACLCETRHSSATCLTNEHIGSRKQHKHDLKKEEKEKKAFHLEFLGAFEWFWSLGSFSSSMNDAFSSTTPRGFDARGEQLTVGKHGVMLKQRADYGANRKSSSQSLFQLQKCLLHLLSVCCDLTSDLWRRHVVLKMFPVCLKQLKCMTERKNPFETKERFYNQNVLTNTCLLSIFQ